MVLVRTLFFLEIDDHLCKRLLDFAKFTRRRRRRKKRRVLKKALRLGRAYTKKKRKEENFDF